MNSTKDPSQTTSNKRTFRRLTFSTTQKQKEYTTMKVVLVSSLLVILCSLDAVVQQVDAFTSRIVPSRVSSTTTATSLNVLPDEQRVVVTGCGVVNGCGVGKKDFFDNVVAGKSSIGKVTRFDAQYQTCQIASEIPDSIFNADDFFTNPKNVKSNDRYTHIAVAAARQALQDAKLGDTPETLQNPERVGVMIGTCFGGAETYEKETIKLFQKPERPRVCI
jgi:Beta-ketoacyl synthase, N-terminal domain